MLTVPIKAAPNQQLQVQLGGQAVALNVRQQAYGLFVDVYADDSLVVAGVIALNLNRIVRDAYLGFSGDLVFADTQGSSDPVYTGLGSRFVLLWLAPADLPAGQG